MFMKHFLVHAMVISCAFFHRGYDVLICPQRMNPNTNKQSAQADNPRPAGHHTHNRPFTSPFVLRERSGHLKTPAHLRTFLLGTIFAPLCIILGTGNVIVMS